MRQGLLPVHDVTQTVKSNDVGPPALRALGVGKSFAGNSVLRDISLDIKVGEIHGLVGENGAGKSTLGKLFGGYHKISTGTLEVFGEPVGSHWDAHTALEHGVAIMHQELQLVPNLTVAQNVFLGMEEHRLGFLRNTEAARLSELAGTVGFDLNPKAVVADLSIADQQKIEILRALARNARVIVMDEPTSSLSKAEVTQLHRVMETLRDNGCSVIYVTHFLDDILDATDRATVLRDGNYVDTFDTASIAKTDLVSAMLGGGSGTTLFPPKKPPTDDHIVLKATDVRSNAGVKGASLHIKRGEIVALVGLVGSGRSEIARAIVGVDQTTAGTVELDNKRYDTRSVVESTQRGLVMVPEDRRKSGLNLGMSVRSNITLPHLESFSKFGWINRRKEKRQVQHLIEDFEVRPTEVDGDIEHYSGGNQQKVLIGKWVLGDPVVMVLDEPSRGVDVGARARIHTKIADLAANGTGILLISGELEETLGLAHRIYVVSNGEIVQEIEPENTNEDSILSILFQHQTNSGLVKQ